MGEAMSMAKETGHSGMVRRFRVENVKPSGDGWRANVTLWFRLDGFWAKLRSRESPPVEVSLFSVEGKWWVDGLGGHPGLRLQDSLGNMVRSIKALEACGLAGGAV